MRNRKLWAMVLTISLTATSLTGCKISKGASISKETKESVEEMGQVADALDEMGLVTHSDTAGKEETVYVIMDANGAKNETIVSEWLKNPEGASDMLDKSALSDIEVVKGSATYTEDSEGQMHWSTDGADVYYQGKTDKDLPLEVKVSYELDGQPVTAEALKDANGHVKIRYDYDNKICKLMEIGGENVEIYQPFTVITGVLLDDEKVTNIKVTDGKVINTGSHTAVFGIAMPGLSESIGLDKIKEESDTDIEIPDSVTIEADVTDFTMPMSMTMVTNDAISTLKLDSNNDKIDELKEKSNELTDGMDELMDGTKRLNDGAYELQDGTDRLSDGVTKLNDGAKELNDGAHELYDGTVELDDGAFKLYDGTNTLHDGTVTLKDGVGKLNQKAPELASGVKQLKDGTDTLNSGIKKVTDNNKTLTDGASTLSAGLKQLNDSLTDKTATEQLGALKNGSSQVKAGLTQLGGGASQVAAGAALISTGTSQVADMTTRLTNGGITPDSTQQLIDALSQIEQYISYTGTISQNALKQNASTANASIEKTKQVLAAYKMALAGLSDPQNGAAALAEGAAKVEAGAQVVSAGLNGDGTVANPGLIASYTQIDGGINKVADNMTTISAGVGKLNAGALSLSTGIVNYTNGVVQIGNGASKLKAGTDTLNGKIPELVKGVSDLNDGAQRLESGACTLKNGAGDLYEGTGKLRDGAKELYDGTSELSDGTKELRDGTDELVNGVRELVDGTGKLNDGVIELNDEGISKITDLIGNDIESYYDRIQALKDFSKQYTTFSGSCPKTEGTVKFIYKTDAVK